jgi:hypothetical protein
MITEHARSVHNANLIASMDNVQSATQVTTVNYKESEGLCQNCQSLTGTRY